MRTITGKSIHIELQDIGGDIKFVYSYCLLYKGIRKAGNVHVAEHMNDDDDFIAATVLTHAGFADEQVVELIMSQLAAVLSDSPDPNILGKLALSGI